jgi:hypothetical protein
MQTAQLLGIFVQWSRVEGIAGWRRTFQVHERVTVLRTTERLKPQAWVAAPVLISTLFARLPEVVLGVLIGSLPQ